MCEYCGCRGVEPIAALMDEHYTLRDLAGDLRRALLSGDLEWARRLKGELVALLTTHVGLEEAGVFAALREQGDFVAEVELLEGQHVDLDRAFADLDLHAPAAASLLDRAVAQLSEHIDREDLGIFPVAVVTLGASGWHTVDRAHTRRAPAVS